MAIGRTTAEVGANDFTHPTYRAVELIAAAGGPVAGSGDAAGRPGCATATEPGTAILALGVEPLLTAKEPDASYVGLTCSGCSS